MDSDTRVSKCKHRNKANMALRGVDEPDCWVHFCAIQHKSIAAHEGMSDNIFCNLHGRTKLCKCEFYNEWSEKQVRDAFEKLEKTERSLAAIRAIKDM